MFDELRYSTYIIVHLYYCTNWLLTVSRQCQCIGEYSERKCIETSEFPNKQPYFLKQAQETATPDFFMQQKKKPKVMYYKHAWQL